MATHQPIFRSFAAGELSPRIHTRTDVGAWDQGLARLTNAVSTSHGPVRRRFGSRHIAYSEGATVAKCIGFQFRKGKAFAIYITDAPEVIFVNISDPVNPVEEQRINNPPWGVDEIPLIQHEQHSEDEAIWLVSPGDISPQEMIYTDTAAIGSQWTLAAINFSNRPPEWNTDGNPTVLTFFQGRSWFAASEGFPQTLWASRSQSFKNFTSGTNPESPISFALSLRGKIEWMAPSHNLVVGTSRGEHLVTSQEGVVTVTDIDVKQQSSYGSTEVQALLIGNLVMYVSPDGRKVRDVGYRFSEDSWMSRDITFLSEHISENNKIRELTWSQQPDNLIWCVTEPGQLLGCTYERHYEVLGWHRQTTQGEYKSVASVDVNGRSTTIYAVAREGGLSMEVLAEAEYLDSMISVEPVGNTISAPHLADQMVQVLIDGAIHPDLLLDAQGEAELQFTGDKADIGLGYTTEIETLPLDYSPEAPGTTAHYMKRWNKIYARLLNSAKPEMGKVGEYARPPERTPATPMNLPEPARSEDVKVIGTGWDRTAQIYIRQHLPLPLMVGGIYGELGQYVDDD